MTSTENATTPTEGAQSAQDGPDAPPEGEHPADQDGPGREAARYRRQLRDAESERDGLRGKVAALQRSEVQRIAAETLAVPSSLWASGIELSSLLGEDGSVDPGLVAAAAANAASTMGLAPRTRNPAPDLGQGQRSQAPAQQETSWADFLAGKSE